MADDIDFSGLVFDAVEVETQAATAQFLSNFRSFKKGYAVAVECEAAADVGSNGTGAYREDT